MGETGNGETSGAPVRVLIVGDDDVLAVSLAHVLDSEPDLVSVGVDGTLAQARALILRVRGMAGMRGAMSVVRAMRSFAATTRPRAVSLWDQEELHAALVDEECFHARDEP